MHMGHLTYSGDQTLPDPIFDKKFAVLSQKVSARYLQAFAGGYPYGSASVLITIQLRRSGYHIPILCQISPINAPDFQR